MQETKSILIGWGKTSNPFPSLGNFLAFYLGKRYGSPLSDFQQKMVCPNASTKPSSDQDPLQFCWQVLGGGFI